MNDTTPHCVCCVIDAPEEPQSAQGRSIFSEHRREILTLSGSALIFALAMIFDEAITRTLGLWGGRAIFAVPYLLCGWPVARAALETARKGDFFNEFSLMFGATLAAIGLDQMPEAVGVMLFYRVGELFQEIASAGSRRSIKSLLASKPATANVLRGDSVDRVPVETVQPGTKLIVRAGESIPLDGEVLSGTSQVDQSPLTGESMPVAVREGDMVMGGTINLDGMLTVRATKAFADTHVARVLEMVENATANKAPTERFISRLPAIIRRLWWPWLFWWPCCLLLPQAETGAPGYTVRLSCWSSPAPAPWSSPSPSATSGA